VDEMFRCAIKSEAQSGFRHWYGHWSRSRPVEGRVKLAGIRAIKIWLMSSFAGTLRTWREFAWARCNDKRLDLRRVLDCMEVGGEELAQVKRIGCMAPDVAASLAKLLLLFASVDRGDGSLTHIEMASLMLRLCGGQSKQFQKRLAPVVIKWDLDGNSTLEFNEFVNMMLCDDNFRLGIPKRVCSNIVMLINTEQPGCVNGEIIYKSS